MPGSIKTLLEKVFNNVRACFFFFVQQAVLAVSEEGGDRPESVLVVRLDAIGDFVLWVESAKALRKLYPSDKFCLTLLCNQIVGDLAVSLGIFDEIWHLDRRKFSKNLTYRILQLRKIQKASFGIAINPTQAREFMYGDSVIFATGADQRIGSKGNLLNLGVWQKRISDRWYTSLVAATPGLNVLEQNAEFLRGLGVTHAKPKIPDLPVSTESVPDLDIPDYFVVFPGAGAVLRQWPIERFAEVADRISSATGWTGVICGGPGEETLGALLEDKAGVSLKNLVAKTTLPELVSIIAGAHLVLANETSAVHIAAAVSTPSVCILGGGHYGNFLPYPVMEESSKPSPIVVSRRSECFGCNWKCPSCAPNRVADCIEGISVEEVWCAVKEILPTGFRS
ncbi:glycosyltransferase family 9 protein [Geomesophilobacter sediminis]|uniref:Glycosyltransferase family 9 protein n=1 Tax=Geomesophilobacter sediminis TaxID=2798584 RepID=A0A8J7S7G9_9BACT|nr:glycosyltransferase family 9 protein [Geomesophilobacter sediminis]MBJ6727031.1 glycosyltransferase family 9 protein [Geomesophilobacter sediminis]